MLMKYENKLLSGKVAFVTAAAGGFGRAIVKGLIEKGADVAMTDIDECSLNALAREASGQGGKVWSGVCDVTDIQQIQAAVQECVKKFGRIDILINIAGCAVLKPALEMSEDELQYTLDSCLVGAFRVSKEVAKVMIENKSGGSIVHVSSIASKRALGRGTGGYAAAKAGLNALVRELAVEWAKYKIRVNAVAPCQFRTAGLEKVLDDAKFGGREVVSEKMLSKIPIGRFGEVEEIVGPAIFMASDESSMITGHLLAVDGGYFAI